jgi:hypothetical protein
MMEDYEQEAFEHSKKFKIDPSKIGEEIENIAATYNYYATLYVRAREIENEHKLKVKEVRGGVWLAIKEQYSQIKPKPTVDDIKAMVEVDQSVLKAERDFRQSSSLVQQLDQDRQACWLKGEMLKLMSFEAARHYKSDF